MPIVRNVTSTNCTYIPLHPATILKYGVAFKQHSLQSMSDDVRIYISSSIAFLLYSFLCRSLTPNWNIVILN